MVHEAHVHTWGSTYTSDGATYRDCSEAACTGHQEWICLLDRWSDTFETPSPRRRGRIRAGAGAPAQAATRQR